MNKASECNQKIPQSHNADQPTAPQGKATEQSQDKGLDGGGVWYSLFIKNLAHYSSH